MSVPSLALGPNPRGLRPEASRDIYSGRLGEIRSGSNDFSFERYEDLITRAVSSLFAEAEQIFRAHRDDQSLAAAICYEIWEAGGWNLRATAEAEC